MSIFIWQKVIEMIKLRWPWLIIQVNGKPNNKLNFQPSDPKVLSRGGAKMGQNYFFAYFMPFWVILGKTILPYHTVFYSFYHKWGRNLRFSQFSTLMCKISANWSTTSYKIKSILSIFIHILCKILYFCIKLC